MKNRATVRSATSASTARRRLSRTPTVVDVVCVVVDKMANHLAPHFERSTFLSSTLPEKFDPGGVAGPTDFESGESSSRMIGA